MLELGEKVEVRVRKENREWGYSPADDGTKGRVVGFAHAHKGRWNLIPGQKSGVYLNRFWPVVQLETGQQISISDFHLKSLDDNPGDGVSFFDTVKRQKLDFVSELPETPFWEGDKVTPKSYDWDAWVYSIDYRAPGRTKGIEYILCETWPCGRGNAGIPPSPRAFGEAGLSLVERGWVWKHHHNEPIEFPDLQSEADFYKGLGLVETVRHPENGNAGWLELSDVLDAIENGSAHAFTASRGGLLGGNTLLHSVYRYNDEELGKRLAAKVLSEFRK